MKPILTISCNDQGISWGPTVHFLELWNAASRSEPAPKIQGIVPTWTGKPTVIDATFPLRQVSVPNIPLFRQIVFDLHAALAVFRHRRDNVYLRLSHWHILTMIAMCLCRVKPFVELNGIMRDDAISAGKSAFFTWLVSFQERWLIRNSACSFAVSSGIAEFASDVGASHVVEVKNGVATSFFDIERTAPPARPRVVYVGTYTSWDGASRVIELAREFPDVDFVMVGEGARKGALMESATDNVVFKGWVPYGQLATVYTDADVGIALYEIERNDMVISSLKTLEYVAAALPVFTTAVPGQEFIADNGIGVTCPIDDISNHFRSFLQQLPHFAESARRFRQEHAFQLSWQRVAQVTLENLKDHA